MIHFSLYCRPSTQEVAGLVEELDGNKGEFMSCFLGFFEGRTLGVWGRACARLGTSEFLPSALLHLLGMARMVESGAQDVGEIPAVAARLAQSAPTVESELAERLRCSPESRKRRSPA